MGRWTETLDEAKHLAGLGDALNDVMGRQARVVRKDGTWAEGMVLAGSAGNNAGRGPRGWQYHASIIVMADGKTVEIDYLDVSNMIPLPIAA